MTSPPFAHLAARALARAEARESGPDATRATARTQAVAAMERALRSRRRQLKLRRVAITCAGAAALAAAVVGLTVLVSRTEPARLADTHRGTPTKLAVTRGAADSREAASNQARVEVVATDAVEGTTVVGGNAHGGGLDGTVLPVGSRIVTPARGSARLALSTGTHLTVGPRSELAVVRDGAVEAFRLEQGELRAEVAKLHIGERFLVNTPDTEIEVRGTIFEVRVTAPSDACEGLRTQLIVTEGVVTVRHDGELVRVTAGERWPNDCGRTHVAGHRVDPAPTNERRPALALGQETNPTAAIQAPFAAQPVAGSRLAAMNDAYARAVTLRQHEDLAAAIAAFTAFTSEYQDGPLAESARVELLRLLVRTDRSRARATAAQYLQDFPTGFAREEAARVLE